jgi:hypothetical protein
MDVVVIWFWVLKMMEVFVITFVSVSGRIKDLFVVIISIASYPLRATTYMATGEGFVRCHAENQKLTGPGIEARYQHFLITTLDTVSTHFLPQSNDFVTHTTDSENSNENTKNTKNCLLM